jgi:D-alanyl-lipoteichoic acid acyltransferase DltB (MBOAT superfamily)
MGGSRKGKYITIRNVLIIFIISGLWHGANWTFVIWGLIHAMLFIPSILTNRNRIYKESFAGANGINFKEILQMILLFIIVSFAWLFFRSPSLNFAFSYLGRLTQQSFSPTIISPVLLLTVVMIAIEWRFRYDERAILAFRNKNTRYITYILLTLTIIAFFKQESPFIYFQF